MNREIGIKFLIWSYFNLDCSECKKDVIDRCIELAYKDATNQGAFNAIKDKGQYNKEEAKNSISEWLEKGFSKSFDERHNELCETLCSCYTKGDNEKSPAFSYGNAQKWVNMTVKYLYIYRSLMLALDAENDFCSFYDEKLYPFEEYFHVPIDSFIMQAIWPEDKEDTDWIPGKKLPKSGPGNYSDSKHTPWSKFSKEDYYSVQDHIKSISGKSPMEWENPRWIQVARERKKNGSDK